MSHAQHLTELLKAAATILESGKNELDFNFAIVVIDRTKENDLCLTIADVESKTLERLLVRALYAQENGDYSYIDKNGLN